MSKIDVRLDTVQVIEGQGVGEGDFELRIQVQEGSRQLVWPALNSSAKVDNGGVPYTINQKVATYDVSAGTITKRFSIDVTEDDKGANGKDDQGHGELSFDLTPTMAPATKYATIALKRPRMNYNGKVKVAITAQRA